MLYSDYTTKLLGLKDAIITNVEQDSDGLHIFLELERATHTSPVCGTLTAHIHDYRTQIIKDLDIRKQQVFLHLRKRRCSCCNKRFQEDNSFLMRYQRMTAQLYHYIITCFADLRSATSIAKECHCSVTKRNQNLTHDEQLQLENTLSVSDELRLAYDIKERFFQLLKIKDTDTFIAKFRE